MYALIFKTKRGRQNKFIGVIDEICKVDQIL